MMHILYFKHRSLQNLKTHPKKIEKNSFLTRKRINPPMEPKNHEDQISEEYICSICWNLLVRPIKFDCEHNFCHHCIFYWLEKEEEGIKCPKCRKFYPITVELKEDKALTSKILNLYKKKYIEREECINRFIKEEEKTGKIRFLYGNYLHKSESGKAKMQEWRFFLKTADPKVDIKKFVEKIEVNLDPAYGAKPIPIASAPFEIKITSTTELDITFKIHWDKWLKREPTSFIYYVTFNGGHGKTCSFQMTYQK